MGMTRMVDWEKRRRMRLNFMQRNKEHFLAHPNKIGFGSFSAPGLTIIISPFTVTVMVISVTWTATVVIRIR
jgi:hypothetical protein